MEQEVIARLFPPLVAISMASILVPACGTASEVVLGQQFVQAVVSQPLNTPFSPAQLASFKWDHFWIEPFGTPADAIDREVGVRVDYAHNEGDIFLSESVCMFVFTYQGRVVAVDDVVTPALNVLPAIYDQGATPRLILPGDQLIKVPDNSSPGAPQKLERYKAT